jgi:hypothetical protein
MARMQPRVAQDCSQEVTLYLSKIGRVKSEIVVGPTAHSEVLLPPLRRLYMTSGWIFVI